MTFNTTLLTASQTSLKWTWSAFIISLVSPLLITYAVSSWNSTLKVRKDTVLKRPPTAPYYLPYFGLAFEFVSQPFALFEREWKRFGRDGLWKITLPGQSSFHVSTADQVAKVFRGQGMLMTESHARSLEYSFGMPSRAALLYGNDDSGYGPHIAPGSKVKPNERVLVTQHDFTARGLSGDTLTNIMSHYQHHLLESLTGLLDDMGDNWVAVPDLPTFIHQHVTKSALIATFGPHLIRLNPDIVEDIWAFIPDVMKLFFGLPRWLLPATYRRRDKIIDGIVAYYKHAHDNYDPNGPDEDWEEFFGSRFTRSKHLNLWPQFEVMDARARAAEELSFLWASNANSVEAIVWSVLEMVRDPELLERVRAEATESQNPPTTTGKPSPLFDLEKLCSMPVSQAVYAEVLRHRVSILVMRKTKQDLNFAGYLIKKGERLGVCSLTRGRDERVWNTGTTEEPHPLDEFWADRFLVYPDDPSSGPLKNPPVSKSSSSKEDGDSIDGPRFSTSGLTNTWIPYSGGARLCPGRHFAKREIIVTTAAMISMFEIELLTPKGWVPQPDTATFGVGTLPVKGKVPFRIRRRKQSEPSR